MNTGTVESAALEYFDSAGGIEDQHAMDMCLKCLSMRPGAKFARSIRDLVEALRLLCVMGLKNRLPAEVRREKDKIEIIRWVFQVNSKAYKNLAANSSIDLPRPPGTYNLSTLKRTYITRTQYVGTTLFRLAQLLGLVSDVDRTRVRVLIAEYALKGNTKFDLDVAYRMCNHLLRDCSRDVIESVQAWRVCAQLATDSRFTDFQARRDLCSFALLYCDSKDEYISKLIEMWREMDILNDMEHGIRISRTLHTSSSSSYDERQGSTWCSLDTVVTYSIVTKTRTPTLEHRYRKNRTDRTIGNIETQSTTCSRSFLLSNIMSSVLYTL